MAVNRGRTKVSELRERIVKLGGTPKGRSIADLLDELEQLMGGGDGGELTPADVERIVAEKLPEVLENMQPAEFDDSDFDDIFGD